MELVFVFSRLASLLFPLIVGPVAAIAFIIIVKRKDRRLLSLFVVLLLLVYFIALAHMAMTFGHTFPGAGFFASTLMPIGIIVSLVILLLSSRGVWRSLGEDRWWRICFVVGVVLIPLLQQLTAEVLPLVRLLLCHWLYWFGLRC